MSSKLLAHGLRIEVPHGWEGRIYRRKGGDPTLHAANFRLPHADGDFGSTATGQMPVGGIFMVLTEYRPGNGLEPGKGLFASRSLPLPLHPRQFSPRTLHVGRRGQAGMQHFFTAENRPFCLYAVIRLPAAGQTHAAAAGQVHALNHVLGTVRFL